LERAGESFAGDTSWSTRRWMIISAVVGAVALLVSARLLQWWHGSPLTARESCDAQREILQTEAAGFFVGVGFAAGTLFFCIKRRRTVAVAFGATTVVIACAMAVGAFAWNNSYYCDSLPP
jgi:hypothetical protein